jgi:hypothetical protein
LLGRLVPLMVTIVGMVYLRREIAGAGKTLIKREEINGHSLWYLNDKDGDAQPEKDDQGGEEDEFGEDGGRFDKPRKCQDARQDDDYCGDDEDGLQFHGELHKQSQW